MSIRTASQSQLGQQTARNSQVITTVTKNYNSGTLGGSGPSITSVVVTDSNYNVIDDTAVTGSNGYIKIVGTGFTSTSNVYIGSTGVPAANVTFVSSTELRARVPVLSVGNYNLSVFNSNSSGAISSSTFIVSSAPIWVTTSPLANKYSGTPFSISLSATSDSNIVYSNTTALPAGTSLLANGYFYGTVTVGSSTTYTFDVKATDVENQDNTKTFSLTVALSTNPGIYGVGYNLEGQLGLNDAVHRSSPVQIGAGTTWSRITGGVWGVLGLKTDNTLWAWGRNDLGTLGQNNRNNYSSPVQIAGSWSWIDSDGLVAGGVKTDGTLWTWGYSSNGAQGINVGGAASARSSPTQVGALNTWSKVYVADAMLASKTDGTLWVCGYQSVSLISTNRSSPVQVGALTNWSNFQASMGYSVNVIKSNGTLWSWGTNSSGSLGNNTTYNPISSPVQIGAQTDWSYINTSPEGGSSKVAVRTNGTMWAWGWNGNYALGLTSVFDYASSPTQIGSDTTWSKGVSGGIGLKTDGTAWVWGTNAYGQLGINNRGTRGSPVQFGSVSNWTDVWNCSNERFVKAT